MKMFNQASQFTITQSSITVIGGNQINQGNVVGSPKDLKWINAPNPFENFYSAEQKIVQGTGTWLLEHRLFQEWKTGMSPFLWLQGKECEVEGTLNILFSTNVIKTLRKDSVFLYYYFDTRNKAKVDYSGIVSSLLHQVAAEAIRQNSENAYNAIHQLYINSKEGKFLIPEDMESTLLDLIAMMDAVYIIIDALDECAEEGKLLALVDTLLTKLKNCFVFVSSRPHINTTHNKVGIISLDKQMSDVGITSDIEKYVDTKLQKQHAWSPELKAEVKDTLVNSANGQIRWVDCQLTALNEIKMPRGIRKALKSLPKTLQETYAKILEQVKDEQKDYVKTIFQWLLFAYRPLTIGEVQHILAIDVEEEIFRPEDLLENIETELHNVVNSSLVVIIQASTEGYRWNKQNFLTVQLAHPSVKDYLLSEAAMQSVSGYFQMNSALAHEAICQMCIVYLLCCGQEAINVEKCALAHYASKYWILHSNQTKEECSAILDLSCKLLSTTQPAYYNWLNVYTPDTWNNKPIYIAQPLYYAGYTGLKSVVMYTLEKGADVNAQGGEYGNALQAASLNGHLEVVRALLEKGVDVNAQGGFYGNALQAASYEGHLEVVRALLGKGADVNAQGGPYGNALQAASLNGHLEVVRALLEKGADVNAQGGEYGNALQAASCYGHLEVVRALLEKGADVNAQGGFYGYALYAASHDGDLEVVRALLEKGADVNAQGGGYGNALQAASLNGHLEVVRALLEKGADVNAQGGHHGYALQAASDNGHLEVVRALLEKGADVNAQGGEYADALQAASFNGDLEVVRALLEKGADVNAQGGYYGNALQAASYNGHLEVVRALLEKGADVNAQGGEYGNALQAASYNGHLEVVRALLGKGADVNAQGEGYGNALQAASLNGDLVVVRALLEKGADVNAQGGYYGNALQAASYNGHLEVVRALLEKGADVNAQGEGYGNALQAASCSGHLEVVRALLEKGADLNAQGGEYGNALQAASYNGDLEVVRVLLEKGADVNAQGRKYSSALNAARYRWHSKVIAALLEAGAVDDVYESD
ncbi:hypothetical protein D9758_016478 [Tetrapyrgos nigripes]|uniref:Uncharacterized protein n=1 Tax=Tetrapyrgos nigripes TaxID=182062 RepID=A0A8H5CMG3_9AGAR|nr:hypothetical protein D9758_016478 [Tetrapyrgos nigripes]